MSHSTDSQLRQPVPTRRGTSQWLRRALIFATVVVLVNALVGDGGLVETLRARREYAEALVNLDAIQQRNAALAETVRHLDGDARTIEGIAREDLGLVRRGEVVFVLAPVR
jgi:cell division protein FtsB